MMVRVGVCGLAITCVLAILFLVALRSQGAETIIYEDLTCEQLIAGYEFNVNVLQDMVKYWDGCVEYANGPANADGHAMLRCDFIQDHATHVQGIANDIVEVFNIKCAPE